MKGGADEKSWYKTYSYSCRYQVAFVQNEHQMLVGCLFPDILFYLESVSIGGTSALTMTHTSAPSSNWISSI